jgi:hypothetical protein
MSFHHMAKANDVAVFAMQTLAPDDFLDLPPLGLDSFLTFDSNSDVFAPPLDLEHDLNVFGQGATRESGGIGVTAVWPSPATSESAVRQQEDIKAGVENVGPVTTERKMVAGEACPGGKEHHHKAPSQGHVEDEAKRQARMKRNRENAFLSRQRKKQQTIELQQQCSLLRKQTTQLTCMVQRLVAENCLLRHHLSTTCQRAGVPVPDVPSALKAAPATPHAAGYGGHPTVSRLGGPGVEPGRASQPSNGLVPEKAVPSGLDIVTPQISGDNKSEGTKTATAGAVGGNGGGRKRARTTGASAAFLALFSIFMFVGPGNLVPGSNFGSKHANMPHSTSLGGPLALLPAGSNVGENEAGWSNTHGRSLLAVQGGGVGQEDRDVKRLEQWPLVVGSDKSEVSKELMALLVNQTLEALCQDPHNHKDLLTREAMDRIKQLGPVAVSLDREVAGGPSITFPLMASHFLEGSGLANPQTCTKVFDFSAATMSNSMRSKRRIDKYVSGSSVGFKGRSLVTSTSEGVLTLSSSSKGERPDDQIKTKQMVVQQDNEREINDGVYDQKDKHNRQVRVNKTMSLEVTDEKLDGYLPEDSESSSSEPALVSLLLPTPSKAGLLSAIDRILIMFLYPGDRFVTYSCGLSRPLLAN